MARRLVQKRIGEAHLMGKELVFEVLGLGQNTVNGRSSLALAAIRRIGSLGNLGGILT